MTAWKPVWHATLLFLLGALWGLQFVLLKIATDAGLGEINILLVSMVLLAAGFLAAMAVAKAWFRPTWRHVRFFLISGFLGFVLPLGGAILAAREISAGVIVLFEALTPIFTMALALVLRTEAMTLRRRISMTLGLLGVLCILAPAVINPGSISLLGIGFALSLPIIYAIECVYVAAHWPSDIRPLQVVTGEAVAGVVLLLPLLVFWDESSVSALSWTYSHWAVLLFVLISFVEAYLYFYLISRAGAVFVSLASLISMFAGIFFGIILIGESHPASVWLAVVLAALALYAPLHKKRECAPGGIEKSKAATCR
ncbi:MAG: DMT family transporter [Alphaproteobacteria bacterium]|nr:DMT family transporter [Alphaproteobacteria bacterium]